MRYLILVLVPIAVVIAFNMAGCSKSHAGLNQDQVSNRTESPVKRGEYLVNLIGCDDCHSPKRFGPAGPEIIPELRLSGFPHDGQTPPVSNEAVKNGWALFSPDLTSAVGPWGQSYAANITSDATGIGNWTEENFVYAIRNGKLKGMPNGRDLLPPMPWFQYRNMTDEDLKAVFAYLQTVPPVRNIVPTPVPPGEAGITSGFRLIKTDSKVCLFLKIFSLGLWGSTFAGMVCPFFKL